MSAAKIIAAMGGLRTALFIAESHTAITGGVGSVSYSGAQAGDLALLIAVQAVTSTPGGWTAAGTAVSWAGSSLNVYFKVLSSGDISTGSLSVTGVNGGTVVLSMYRGPTVATVVSTAQTSAGSPLTIPGFTRSTLAAGEVSHFVTSGASGIVTPPPIGTVKLNAGSVGSYTPILLTFLPGARYPSGTSLTWAWGNAPVTSAVAQIIELT
jgi:hypothetical protein